MTYRERELWPAEEEEAGQCARGTWGRLLGLGEAALGEGKKSGPLALYLWHEAGWQCGRGQGAEGSCG